MSSQSSEARPPEPYMRKALTTDGTLQLEVSARAFQPRGKRGSVIWLVGVTHLGEPEYYDALQQFLGEQSVVLFEGIGATNSQFQVEDDEAYSLQADLAQSLGLEFQLDAIDYDQANFRNCDLSVEQLFRLLHPNATHSAPGPAGNSELENLLSLMQGEGFLGTLARFGIGLIASSPRLQATVKVVMIETFDALPADLQGLPGLPVSLQNLMRLLIDERNQAVLVGVEDALNDKPRPRSVAVFYGAGHMTDLETRVRERWRCRPSAEHWFTAFTVNPRKAGVTDFELGMIRQLLRQQLGTTNKTAGASSKDR